MKFSVNWLREFVELPSNVDELAELLTMAGIEIEGIEKRGANFDKVVVAQIKASEQHPNADRLSVCQVDDGRGETRQIVCGAKNCQVGDKVPLALPGAVLVGDLKIKPSKLRGVESQGMLCSPSELGLSEDSDGLLILSPDAKIGEPIASLFPEDTIFDVEITPNRGDLLSHFGLARDIAALVGQPLRLPSAITAPGWAGSIEISAADECPFISFRKIDNVKVGPSPDWLRAKIESVGIRSINNIVDISNFVMVELGQPTHAFDADKLKGAINVRLARDGEKFLALDGKTYGLNPENLVIADQERAVGLAGVMGGEETGVSETTKNILLEAAWFLPTSVRRTARTLNLPSDASYRFERRVDPGMVLAASNRAAELMREIAGAKPAAEIATAGKLPSPPSDVSLRYAHVDELIGISILPTRVDEILQRFGLQPASSSKEQSSWRIPSHRFDLRRDVDLIEEIVRAFGIENVPVRYRSQFTASSEADRMHDLQMGLRLSLVMLGYSEVRTSKLIPRSALVFDQQAVQLKNPLSEDHVALRSTLMPGLIGVLERNIREGAEQVKIFELSKVFIPPDAQEQHRLGILAWRKLTRLKGGIADSEELFLDVKETIASALRNPSDKKPSDRLLAFRQSVHPELAFTANIFWGDVHVGFVGQLHRRHARMLETEAPICIVEIDFQMLGGKERDVARGVPIDALLRRISFSELSRYPAIRRDIAMVAPDHLSYEKILQTIWDSNEPLLERVEFFDRYIGPDAERRFGKGKKSMAYALTYRAKTRTLTNEEITAVHAKIRERLQRELGVELRE
ncbi:MAG: phenylalanine--tRNA ligase subunit beta [Chthoniobacterales bacterium]